MSRCPRQKACRVFTTRQNVEKSNTCWTVNSLLKVNMEIMNFRSCSHQNGYETLHGGSLLEIKTSFCAEMNQCQVPLIYHQTCITMNTHAHTHAQVCAQQGARIWLHKICCCHGAALHLLTLPWKHKNDDWHGALSEMGQEHPSQVKSNQIYEHGPASLKNLSGLDSADPDRDQRWKNPRKSNHTAKTPQNIIWLSGWSPLMRNIWHIFLKIMEVKLSWRRNQRTQQWDKELPVSKHALWSRLHWMGSIFCRLLPEHVWMHLNCSDSLTYFIRRATEESCSRSHSSRNTVVWLDSHKSVWSLLF